MNTAFRHGHCSLSRIKINDIQTICGKQKIHGASQHPDGPPAGRAVRAANRPCCANRLAARASPAPGQTCPATVATGMPGAVQPFRTATRARNPAARRPMSRAIGRRPGVPARRDLPGRDPAGQPGQHRGVACVAAGGQEAVRRQTGRTSCAARPPWRQGSCPRPVAPEMRNPPGPREPAVALRELGRAGRTRFIVACRHAAPARDRPGQGRDPA